MRGFITRVSRIRKVLLGRDLYRSRQIRRERWTMGNRFSAWTIFPKGIHSQSIVYSFGVGEDISWDLQLIEKFGLEVHAFDPSPISIKWIESEKIPSGFHFYPYGLANEDGEILFQEPDDPHTRSLRMTSDSTVNADDDSMKRHILPVKRLETIMMELGHKRIDILKMDIEGAEYNVIEDILVSEIPISQLLVEFHHRFSSIGTARTRKAIRQLNKAGYRIFHVSDNGEEFSFMKA